MPELEVNPINIRDATYVLAHLRPIDRMELGAILPQGVTPVEAANMVLQTMNGPAYSVSFLGQPVAVFGVSHTTIPTLFVGYAFGTNRFNRAAPIIADYGFKRLAPWMIKHGGLRLEIRAHEDHHASNKWLRRLGFNFDTPLKCFGTDGATFNLYSATVFDYKVRTEQPTGGVN